MNNIARSLRSPKASGSFYNACNLVLSIACKFDTKHISCHRNSDRLWLLSIHSRQRVWCDPDSNRVSNQGLWQSQVCSSCLRNTFKYLVLVQSRWQVLNHLCRYLDDLVEVVWLYSLVCSCHCVVHLRWLLFLRLLLSSLKEDTKEENDLEDSPFFETFSQHTLESRQSSGSQGLLVKFPQL